MIDEKLTIEYLSPDLLKPYKNNPRINDKAVPEVRKSIKKYGFKVPIVVDKNNVIVCGHTRLKAAKKLRLKEVPVIRADDLTPEQIKEFRLIDNKTQELATWDIEKLEYELDGKQIQGFDVDWGIDLEPVKHSEDPERDNGYYGDERARTTNSYNLQFYDSECVDGKWGIPMLDPCNHIPEDLISFNYVLSAKEGDKQKGVHFFIDDYQFERVWNDPMFYIDKLKEFDCVLTPQFSLYTDMPLAMQIWNRYRSQQIGRMLQDAGVWVIPSLCWSDERCFSFCFDGVPHNSVVAISTVGGIKEKTAYENFIKGCDEAIRILAPSGIILYGSEVDYDFKDIPVYRFSNRAFVR